MAIVQRLYRIQDLQQFGRGLVKQGQATPIDMNISALRRYGRLFLTHVMHTHLPLPNTLPATAFLDSLVIPGWLAW